MVRRLQWSCILLLFLVMNCAKEPSQSQSGGFDASWNRLSYFPLEPGTTWMFSGPYGRVVLVDTFTHDRQNRGTVLSELHLDFFDGSPDPRLRETFVVSDDQIYWKEFNLPNLPLIRFDPPLPLLPPSSRPGDSLVVDSKEQWVDSVGTSFAVRGVLSVVGVEDVRVPGGNFEDCIRVRQEILYEDRSIPHLFTWIEFWYAKEIGWVKYASEAGSGELLSAMIGDKRYP